MKFDFHRGMGILPVVLAALGRLGFRWKSGRPLSPTAMLQRERA